jgi:hypothetical protein
MKTSRKTRQGQSVRERKKREPMVIEVTFSGPAEESKPPSVAQPAQAVDPTDSPRDPVRLVFRF